MSVEAPENCVKCGRAKRSAVAGSLTQWLFNANACDCDFLKLAAEIDHYDFEKEKLCSTCGKRVNVGRKGSLTQWVFRADTCSCNREELSSADFSPSRLPLPDDRKKTPSYVADEALTAQLGLSAKRYFAINLIGKGSGARVYKCWDKTLNKPVAIKQLVATKLNEQEIIRFQEEARSTSILSHSSIVRVFDFGQNENGQPFMVMEFIDGKSLDALIEENGPMPAAVLALIMISVCSGMHHAHQSGVFHRDLKSSNIMIPLVGSGAAPLGKVIDFGVAAMHKSDNEEGVFQGHPIAGTPGYMSPDQLRGESFDQRSDIYSLGCTMFEALTGRVPFKAQSSIDVFSMHANVVPPRLVDVAPEIDFPETLEKIVAKTLSKEKVDRYQSMLELKSALEEFLEEHGTVTSDGGDDTASADTDQRKPVSLWVYAVSGILAASIATVVWMKVSDSDVARKNQAAVKSPVVKPAIDEFASDIFHLESTNMSDEKLKDLPRDTQQLDLVASDVTNEGMKYLIGLPIKELRVDATKITDEGLKYVGQVKSLQMLNVGDNPQITAIGVKYLEALPQLDFLSLNATQMGDQDLKSLSNFKSLTRLSLGAMKNVTGTGFVYLTTMPRLTGLRISGVKLTKDGARSLARLKNITDLEFRTGQISDEFIDAVLGMKNLMVLNVSESTITDEQLLALGKLKNLKILRIEKCPKLTISGITRLAKQLPNCSISDGRTSAF